ncbi:MAG TPA: AbrB/MazE/SpoVT family DNA-binding domain-containing protein [Trueperaceae bacterium]
MTSVKLGERYQVVVPKDARRALRLSPGDRLEVTVVGDTVVMRRQESATSRLFGQDEDVWQEVDVLDYVRGERTTWRD